MEEKEAAGLPERSIDASNIGNRMLQKMGWKEGLGLGKTNQGRTNIIEVSCTALTCLPLSLSLWKCCLTRTDVGKKETSISTGKSLVRSSVLSYANSQLPFYSNLWMGRKVVRARLNLFLWPSYKSFQGASRYCIAIVVTGEQEGIDSTSQFQPRLYPTQPHSAQILYSSQPHSSLPFRDQSLRREET